MNIRQLSDQDLLSRTENLARQEREIITQILSYLEEVDGRKLYSELGYTSLYDYAVKRLGYSSDQAIRRIAAMRLVREFPHLMAKVQDGSLNLTTLGMAYRLFRQEKMDGDEKLEILGTIEGKTTREAEKILAGYSSVPIDWGDRFRAVGEDQTEVRFIADDALLAKFEKLRGLLAHSHPGVSLAELLHKVCDVAIERLSPAEKKSPPGSPGAPKKPRIGKSRVIPQVLVREVWQRANGKCQKCGSTYALQVEHCVPFALGGETALDNLRLLCRSCNQRTAIQAYGMDKMRKFLRPSERT